MKRMATGLVAAAVVLSGAVLFCGYEFRGHHTHLEE